MNRMHYFLLGLVAFATVTAKAQVKIGDNPNTIQPSAILEVESANKALLFPRVNGTSQITSPVNGMVVYDNLTNTMMFYQNGSWMTFDEPCASAPSALNSTSVATTTATLNWTAATPAPANGYDYYYSTSATTPASSVTPSGSVAAGNTQVNLNGLTGGITYHWWVRSKCSVSGKGNWISGGSFTTTAACAVPTNLTAAASVSTATLSWTAASPAPANGYDYYYSTLQTAPVAGTTPSGSVAAGTTTVNVSGLASTTPYYWWVRSKCSAGANSTWEQGANFNTVCNPPTGLSASVTSTTTATLSWTAASPAPANGYEYYVNTMNTTPAAGATPTGTASGASVGVTGLAAATTYYWWVRSKCNTTISGQWQPGSSFTTNCNAPSSFSATVTSPTTATISWAAASPAPSSGYEYYYSSPSSTTPAAGVTPSGSVAAGVTTANLTGLTTGSTYYWWVRSKCSASTSGTWTPGGSFTPACAMPSSGPVVVGTTPYFTGFSWSAASPAPANGYDFYMSTNLTDPTAGTSPTASVGAGTTSVSLNVSPGTQYRTWVRSRCGGSYNSDWKQGVTYTTPAACSPPSNPYSYGTGSTTAYLSWSAAPSFPSSYEVYLSTSNSAPSASTGAQYIPSSTSLTLNGLQSNFTYYWWVRVSCSTWLEGGSFSTANTTCGGYTNQSSNNILTSSGRVVKVTRNGGDADGNGRNQCSLSASSVVVLKNLYSVTYTFDKPIDKVDFYGFDNEYGENQEGFYFEGFNGAAQVGVSQTVNTNDCNGASTNDDIIRSNNSSVTAPVAFKAEIRADSGYITSLRITRVGSAVDAHTNAHRLEFCNTTVQP